VIAAAWCEAAQETSGRGYLFLSVLSFG